MDIMKFCSKIPRHDKTNKPFNINGHTYATNGHLILKVPAMPEYADNGNMGPNKAATMDEWASDVTGWFPCPTIPEILDSKCTVCNGRGRAFLCPECDGSGEVEPATKFNVYESEQCYTCGGSGQIVKANIERLKKKFPSILVAEGECQSCEGSGVHSPRDKSVYVGQTPLSDRYLSWLCQLPNCEIGPTGKQSPARFRFTGGEGLIMPRKED